jgi:hypothetical protein
MSLIVVEIVKIIKIIIIKIVKIAGSWSTSIQDQKLNIIPIIILSVTYVVMKVLVKSDEWKCIETGEIIDEKGRFFFS